MVDSKKPEVDRLPIKLIMPKQGAEKRVPGGGTPPKPFRTVDAKYRASLVRQVSAISDALKPQMKQTGAAAVRVKLIAKAAAKSHRPEKLFTDETCPIVGAGRLGELFVKATPSGLTHLAAAIERNQSDRVIKELSCIESIEAVTPAYRRAGLTATEVLTRSPRGETGFLTRVKLFDLGGDEQGRSLENFKQVCTERKIRLSSDGYSLSSFTYGAECHSVDDVEALSKVIGVRAISGMPSVRSLRPQMFNAKPLPKLPARTPTDDVPVVAVVDSGITSAIPELESWVVGRESLVAPKYRNTDHGTFVAGLVCWGAELNPTLAGLDSEPCAVFDLQVIPNEDPSKGDTEPLYEQEFLVALETSLRQHANNFRVWNLSLSSSQVCSLDEFSPLAEELDNLQEKYKVSFVISSGNFVTPPLLDYPRSKAQLDTGRITAPADSVLGITVGSLSHVDYKKGGPKQHEPSAYSRHGAGPNHVIKPDLVHYGGSCSTDFAHISGIRSVSDGGSAENLGTSFATPLVSRTLAQIITALRRRRAPCSHGRCSLTMRVIPERRGAYLMAKRISLGLDCLRRFRTALSAVRTRPLSYLMTFSGPVTTLSGMIFLIHHL